MQNKPLRFTFWAAVALFAGMIFTLPLQTVSLKFAGTLFIGTLVFGLVYRSFFSKNISIECSSLVTLCAVGLLTIVMHIDPPPTGLDMLSTASLLLGVVASYVILRLAHN